MTIEKLVNGTETTLKLTGWLDTQSAPELQAALDAIGTDVQELVLDLDATEYMSSAGLRQLVAAHKKMDGHLTIANVSEELMSVIKMTGLEKRLHIL